MPGIEDYKPVVNNNGMREINPYEIFPEKTHRQLRSQIVLPSQYSSYAICVEFAKRWFLEKFPEHFFNSVFVEGSHSFDEFRKFSDINAQLRRSNPLCAIVPEIDMAHNRQWIDTTPEFNLMLRRAKFEGSFLHDVRDNRGLHLQIHFKTVLMTFTFKIRVDTKAEQLDMMEYIKMYHRAGMSGNQDIDLDVHVPRQIISQIAFDNNIKMYDNGVPVDSIEMLKYLNSHSVIPFLYKLRCATGNNEYFIKVPNCSVHWKTELPTADGGERQDTITTNYEIDMTGEFEMTAPYCYTYYSEKDQNYLGNHPLASKDNKNSYICIMKSALTIIPPENEKHWKLLTDEPIHYEIDESDLNTEVDIDFSEQFADTDLLRLIKHSLDIKLSPYLFMEFKVFNDTEEVGYSMDWDKMIMHINSKANNQVFIIGIYCDNEYINDTIIQIDDMKNNSSRV